MRLTPLVLFVSLAGTSAQSDEPLRVMRATPRGQVTSAEVVRVTFDRPVAAGLGETVDPDRIFTISPPVDGRVEWRDPVTLRFTPSQPLPPAGEFIVTISTDFQAMDGSRLAEPYLFTFKIAGPRVIAGLPVGRHNQPPNTVFEFARPDQLFDLLLSAPATEAMLADLTSAAYLSFAPACGGPDRVALRVSEQRPLDLESDHWVFTAQARYGDYAGANARRLRVLTLSPTEPLPYDCRGQLNLPHALDVPDGSLVSWVFHTYGPLRLESAICGRRGAKYCPTGPAVLYFGTPVSGAELQRHVALYPDVTISVHDTLAERDFWHVDAELAPRTSYAVVLDTALTDVFGQRVSGATVAGITTTGYAPNLSYGRGGWLVERSGPRGFSVTHINIDTLVAMVAGVPRSYEHRFLWRNWWNWWELWDSVSADAARRPFPVPGDRDRSVITPIRMPVSDARRADAPTLLAVRFDSPQLDTTETGWRYSRPVSVVQVTDLGIHARMGAEEAAVWVTGVSDGLPRPGAAVTLYDREGKELARDTTDADGLASFGELESPDPRDRRDHQGYIAAVLEDDRALVTAGGYDPFLAPWSFGARAAYGSERAPVAGAVFTERGIYRPGERVYAKAIVRRGPLGDLRVSAADSLRWRFADREREALKDTVIALSEFGTSDQALRLPTDAPLGQYQVTIYAREAGDWQTVGTTGYRVAEYRPPEFLVDATTRDEDLLAGDTFHVDLEARYLFGAPMGQAQVSWTARERPTSARSLDIPGTDGYYLGIWVGWGEEPDRRVRTLAQGQAELDEGGHLRLAAEIPTPRNGGPAETTIAATVVDINRQAVSASASVISHPASFYIAAQPAGARYFWRAGERQEIDLIAVRPDGERVDGVRITGVAVRREWHRVRRQRGARYELVGEWVSDTVATCTTVSAAEPVACRITPAEAGTHVLTFRATDRAGREAVTGFYRWVVGPDWVPWYDDTQLKMDVIVDRDRYEVGDTATVLFASPFTDAEAWVTVEREGLIEQRRLRVAAGATTLRFPITEAYAPNAFVSMLVVRGRSAPPGPPDDPGRPTIRVGYAELRVAPEVKRLSVDVRPLRQEYRPGDSVRVALLVRDREGRGQRSEVTLWAVDEGVLALTGYETPDPIDLIYRPRGLGMQLTSNMVAIAEQIAEEAAVAKGEPGGGGGMDAAGILRSRFQTTAFFLGSLVTDGDGRAVATAKLPDNLTTFRVMAVAVTRGDRYGSGESSLLVTRPLLARPALPRFLRPGDEFTAGVVVNQRLGDTPTVEVEAEVEDVRLLDPAEQRVMLAAGRGVEARFRFRGLPDADSATFRFRVSGAGEADAVQRRIRVRPDYHPRAHTVSGVLWDTAQAELVLPGDIDPARSRLELSLGGSPLAFIQGARRELRLFPYYCSEQVASVALPLIALYRAEQALGAKLLESSDPKPEIEEAVNILSRRQRADGGIGFWDASSWTTMWLTAYVGEVLLEARSAGIAVDDSALSRLADYLQASLRRGTRVGSPLQGWYRRHPSISLSDDVAAVDVLSRLDRADLPSENSLLGRVGQMAWEDRVRLAEVIARRDRAAARRLLEILWTEVEIDGRRAVLPDTSMYNRFYFYSRARPLARLFTATLAVDPGHPLVAPMLAGLVSRGRIAARRRWTTQDYGATVLALLRYEGLRADGDGRLTVAAAGRRIAATRIAGPEPFDTVMPLNGLLSERRDGGKALDLSLGASNRGSPVFYYATVHEVPQQRPVRPGDAGIQVERWYERYDEPGVPIIRVEEGDLVRVRLRITVPRERHFFVLDDALPAGLEPVDVSLETEANLVGADLEARADEDSFDEWWYGRWYHGYWSPFDHRELRDDRVVYFATVLWPGTYQASYLARATTPGEFIRPPAHAEEMYSPEINGRSDGGAFTVRGAER